MNDPASTDQDNDIAQNAAKALGLVNLLPAVYQDLLQPAARNVGQQLVVVSQAIGIALAPLELALWGYERIKNYLSVALAVKLATKAPESIKAPDPTIAGPIVFNMIFAAEAQHLREMYASLLASAMHAPTAPLVHPSYCQTVQQLSSDEARLLEYFATKRAKDLSLVSTTG